MITDEERQSIINEAVEKALLLIPEVVGNLIVGQMRLTKANREFYERHPEFAKHKELVASLLEKIDAENPGVDYQEKLEKAIPLLKEQIKIPAKLDMKTLSKPVRNVTSLDLPSGHGEI